MLKTESNDIVDASFRAAHEAVELWASGNRHKALEHLLSVFKENPVCGTDWSWLAATWQLVLGQSETQALETLRQYPSFVPEWDFATALCLYKQLGDTAVSRAALSSGFEEGSPIGWKLLGKLDKELEEGLELEGAESYPENAKKLWEETPQALRWLKDNYNNLVEASGEAPVEPDATNRTHYKLWSDNFQVE